MGPHLLIDKSAIQALSSEEIETLGEYFSLVITPILLEEILSNLQKFPDDESLSKQKVSTLARKCKAFHTYYLQNYLSLTATELVYGPIPMNGQILRFDGTPVTDDNGSSGVVFDEQPEAAIMRRWEQGDFSKDEEELSRFLKRRSEETSLAELKANTIDTLGSLPKLSDMAEAFSWTDGFFKQVEQRGLLLTWLQLMKVLPHFQKKVMDRWDASKPASIESFSPYTYFYIRTALSFNLGIALELIPSSKKAKAIIDVQYAYYAPFSHCFTSFDLFHKTFVPPLLRADQLYIDGTELKTDLRVIESYWKIRSPREKQEHRESYGFYPPEIPNSIIVKAWDRTMVPREQYKKGRETHPKMSPEEEKQMIAKLNSLVEKAFPKKN